MAVAEDEAEFENVANDSFEHDEIYSDDDVGEDLPQDDYERRRSTYLRKIILAENHFQELKVLVKEVKLRQLERRRREILNGTHSELLAKLHEVDEEFSHRERIATVTRNLEMDALERRTTAMKVIALQSQQDNKEMIFELMRSKILADIDKLEREQKMNRETLLHVEHRDRNYVHNSDDDEEDEVDYDAIQAERERLSFPVVIHQLAKEDILEDVRAMELAIEIAESHENARVRAEAWTTEGDRVRIVSSSSSSTLDESM